MTPCLDHGKTRSLRPEGYALVGIPGVAGRCVNLHRLVYCQANNCQLADIKGKVVRHTCDNPRCIEPTHLIIGTVADNNKDRAKRKRSAKQVPSRQRLDMSQCTAILARYTPKRCGLNGVRAIARDYAVNPNVIYAVVRGTYGQQEPQ